MDCHVLLAVHATNEVKTFRVDHEVSFFSRYFFLLVFIEPARRRREGERRRLQRRPQFFRFLSCLAVRKIPLTESTSWELVCQLNALFAPFYINENTIFGLFYS